MAGGLCIEVSIIMRRAACVCWVIIFGEITHLSYTCIAWNSGSYMYVYSCQLVHACELYSPVCTAFGSCDDVPERVKTEELADCCEGFIARSEFDEDYHNLVNVGVRREPLGCPVGEIKATHSMFTLKV